MLRRRITGSLQAMLIGYMHCSGVMQITFMPFSAIFW